MRAMQCLSPMTDRLLTNKQEGRAAWRVLFWSVTLCLLAMAQRFAYQSQLFFSRLSMISSMAESI